MASKRQAGIAVIEADRLFEETLDRIQALCERVEGWNGYDVAAPNPSAIVAAKRWVEALYTEVVGPGRPWIQPHVSSDEDGNVALTWDNDSLGLDVYIKPDNAKAIMSWGADINTEM